MNRALLFAILSLALTSMSPHKFYVSLFELNHKPETQALQLTVKSFVDDLEGALGVKNEDPQLDSLHAIYLSNHFEIEVNGKVLKWSYLGSEMDEQDYMVRWTYIEIPFSGKIETVGIRNTYLMPNLPDQVNIIQFTSDWSFSEMLTKNNPKLEKSR